MSGKALFVMDMPEKCLECQMLNGSDECILQSEDQNFDADTWDDLMNGCPLKPMPEKRSGVDYLDTPFQHPAFDYGWNACIDEILEGCKDETD